jgi:hypothetical protein
MIFAAKPVPCRLKLTLELLAEIDGQIPEILHMLSTEVGVGPYRATEQVTLADAVRVVEKLRALIDERAGRPKQ